MLEKIKRAIIEGTFFQKVYDKVKNGILNCFNGTYLKRILQKLDMMLANHARRKLVFNIPINNNKIFFTTFSGSYNCNPKAIVEEIIRQKLPWELVWVGKKNDLEKLEQFPPRLKVVLWESYEFYKEAASAKIWISNSTYLTSLSLNKKPGQIFIQTWHGSIGLKRFETNKNRKWIKTGISDGARTDYCISNSEFESTLYHNTFWKNAEVLMYGHARNDILLTSDLNKTLVVKKEMRTHIQIPEGTKVVLYAPTFRDSKSLMPYNLDFEALKLALECKFGGDWIILCRFHFQVKRVSQKQKKEFPKFVIDVTDYEDIQDILLITDIGITDYSSWICDYILTRRPAFLFATDLRNYYDERGFYYSLETTPFPLAQNNQELVANILAFDEKKYQEACESFLADKGCIDDGHAAERVVEKLKELLGDGKI